MIAIKFEGPTIDFLKNAMRAAIAEMDGGTAASSSEEPRGDTASTRGAARPAPKPARGRPPKSAKPAEVEEEEEDETEEGEEAPGEEDEDFNFDDEEEVEEKKPAGKKKPVITESQIIAAFRAYASANSREAAGKILKKFGVKSTKDLTEDQYSDVLSLLTSKK